MAQSLLIYQELAEGLPILSEKENLVKVMLLLKILSIARMGLSVYFPI
jgi:hypothetical protein